MRLIASFCYVDYTHMHLIQFQALYSLIGTRLRSLEIQPIRYIAHIPGLTVHIYRPQPTRRTNWKLVSCQPGLATRVSNYNFQLVRLVGCSLICLSWSLLKTWQTLSSTWSHITLDSILNYIFITCNTYILHVTVLCGTR